MTSRILVAGSAGDPCLALLVREAQSSGYEVLDARLGHSEHRTFRWCVEDGTAHLEGRLLDADAAFLRIDAPAGPNRTGDGTSLAELLTDWALSRPRVAMLNRFKSRITDSRAATLSLARACGLRIPKTELSNAALRSAPPPSVRSITVEPLRQSELRVYVAGEESFAFSIEAPAPEGRVERGCLIAPVPVPMALLDPIHSVVRALGMDFGSATFRTCPRTGELLFHEIDSSPSFARCDRLSGSAICRAILKSLLEPPSARRPTGRPPAIVEAPESDVVGLDRLS